MTNELFILSRGVKLVQVLNINMPTDFEWNILCVLNIAKTVTLQIFEVMSNISKQMTFQPNQKG
jgi:hypothetical protein